VNRRSPVRVLFSLSLSASLACSRSPAPDGAASSARDAAPALVASAAPADAAPFDWTALVGAYFARYASKSFDFMRTAYAPHVEQFITMKNTTPDDVAKASEAFFAKAIEVEYKLDPRSVRVAPSPDGARVDCDVDMSWTTPIPEQLSSSTTHAVHVTVALTFDAEHRITRYVETSVRKDYLRYAERDPVDCYGHPMGEVLDGVKVPYGTVVEDLHESRYIFGGEESFTERYVRFHGKSFWVTDHLWSSKFPCDQRLLVPVAARPDAAP
jgi:hypothetical protein